MRARHSVILILAALLPAACSEPAPPTRTVELSGTIVAPETVQSAGKVRVNLYHLWALEGRLRHPLQEIESFDAALGPFSHEFEYPLDKGEGLAVHAWLDVDGDGVFCTPTVRQDIAGLTALESLPDGPVEVTVRLEQPCAAAGWFYPPPGDTDEIVTAETG